MSETIKFMDLISKHSSLIKKLMTEVKNSQKVSVTYAVLLDFMQAVLSDSKCSPSYPVSDGRMRGVFMIRAEGYDKCFEEDLKGFTVVERLKDKHSHLVYLISYDTIEMLPSVKAFWLYLFDTVFKYTESLSRKYQGTDCKITQLRAGMYILTYCVLMYTVINRGDWRNRGNIYSDHTLVELHPVSFYQSAPLVISGIASDCNITYMFPSVYFDESCLKAYIKDVSHIEDKVTFELYRDSFFIYPK